MKSSGKDGGSEENFFNQPIFKHDHHGSTPGNFELSNPTGVLVSETPDWNVVTPNGGSVVPLNIKSNTRFV